jgi:hypothetical protein
VDSLDLFNPERKRLHPLALESFSREKAEALFAILKKNQTWQCPTLFTLRNTSHLGDTAITNDARVRFMSQSIRSSWNPANDIRHRSMSPEDIVLAKAAYHKQFEILGAMHRAGVPILAGTM